MADRVVAIAVLMIALAGGVRADEEAIQAEIVVDAPRSEVWKAWTTTEGVTTFFAPNANVELRHGGPFELYFVPDAKPGLRGSEGCTVLGYVAEEMLSFSWNAPPKFEEMRGAHTFVVLRFSDTEGGTRVQLTNGGYGSGEKWDAVRDYFTSAWPRVLVNLRRRFEAGPLWSDGERMQITNPKMRNYVYFITPVRAAIFEDGGTEAEKEAIEAHKVYLQRLLAEDRVVLAGPCTGPAQLPGVSEKSVAFELERLGIVIFRAEDDIQAKAIMEADPAVEVGVFRACVYPFAVVFQRH